MGFKTGLRLFFMVLLTSMVHTSYAQTTEQKALEEKREKLQQEIRDINRLLFAEKEGKR